MVVENDRRAGTDKGITRGALRLRVGNFDVKDSIRIARPFCTRRQAVAGTATRRDASVLEADDIFFLAM